MHGVATVQLVNALVNELKATAKKSISVFCDTYLNRPSLLYLPFPGLVNSIERMQEVHKVVCLMYE